MDQKLDKMLTNATEKELFRDLDPDDPDPEATEIESLCLNCGENGMTKLLLTKIPHYKEVVIMSFDCGHCGNENNEIQPCSTIEEKGIRFTLDVTTKDDLDRQLVKSDFTRILIPSIDFEIPSRSQKGEVTTMEGVIERAIRGLLQDQPSRREADVETANKIDSFIQKLESLREVEEPFKMIIEDISGNCYVENRKAPSEDPQCHVSHFMRKPEDDQALGIYSATEGVLGRPEENFTFEHLLEDEVLNFPTNCPNCSIPCETKMKLTKIPYFKEIVIMATTCDDCGLRTNEVKSSGGIEPHGIKIVVNAKDRNDLTRDILKSDTCTVHVPEIGLDIGATTLGGRFTTIEGMLVAVRDQLFVQSRIICDKVEERISKFDKFLNSLNELITGDKEFTLIMDDPAGNSYVQIFNAPDPDPNLTIEKYERSFDQNEDLGLNDMKTENY